MKDCCAECRFWLASDDEESDVGECHRFPPLSLDAHNDIHPHGLWLYTFEDDWCGEFVNKAELLVRPETKL